MTSFKDHFSGHADDYRRFRPTYPDTLFERLLALAPKSGWIWDCATGNGQAAQALARLDPVRRSVVASDASRQQIIETVTQTERKRSQDSVESVDSGAVHYTVFPAEAPPLATGSMALVTVAQALHWFDHLRFYAQVQRVLRPDGWLAAWCYLLMRVEPEIDRVIDRYYTEVVGSYWPPERRLLEQRYQTLEFPFDEIGGFGADEEESPGSEVGAGLEMTTTWSLNHLLGYLGTWSASRRYMRDRGSDPRREVASALRQRWGNADRLRVIRWPLAMRLGRRRG